MKDKIKNASTAFMNTLPFIFTIVASIATTWYFLTLYNVMDEWWSLPVLAGVSGISLLIPLILKNEKSFPLWSLPFSGISILFYQILSEFLTFEEIWHWVIILIPLALVAEVIAHKSIRVIHPADVIVDIILSFITALAINKIIYNYEIIVLLVLYYLVVILFDIKVQLNIKGTFWFTTKE